MRLLGILLLAAALPLAAQKIHEYCKACHVEQYNDFETHPHFKKELSCDICHGPSQQHRDTGGSTAVDKVAPLDEQPALCGACHSGPGKDFAQSKHGKVLAEHSAKRAASCTTCHGNHAVRTAEQRMRQCAKCHARMPDSHPKIEAKADCHACHAKHTLFAKK